MRTRSMIPVLVVAVTFPFLSGCKEKFTRTRYETLMVGVDTKLNVETTLGDPEVKMGETWRYNKHDKHIFVRFDFDESGKVQGKSWADGKSGEWTGQGSLKEIKPEGLKAVDQQSHTTVDK